MENKIIKWFSGIFKDGISLEEKERLYYEERKVGILGFMKDNASRKLFDEENELRTLSNTIVVPVPLSEATGLKILEELRKLNK